MFRGGVRAVLFCSAVLLTALIARGAWAESDREPEARKSSRAMESELRRQEEVLDRTVGGLVSVGEKLEESQGQVGEAKARQKEHGRRVRELKTALESQREASDRSRARFEERARLAYRGMDVEGLLLLLESLFNNGDERGGSSSVMQVTSLLVESRKNIQDHKDAKQNLRSTLRQVEQSKAEYREFEEEGEAFGEELEGRESELGG